MTGDLAMQDPSVIIPFRNAHDEFVRTLFEGWDANGLNTRLQETYDRYSDALSQAGASPQAYQVATGAFREFTEIFQKALASSELPDHLRIAYGKFVVAVQSAWAQTDPEAVGP